MRQSRIDILSREIRHSRNHIRGREREEEGRGEGGGRAEMNTWNID